MKKQITPWIALAFLIGFLCFAEAATPVRIIPFQGGCRVDDVAVNNQSTTSWNASGVQNMSVLFQTITDVDVYIGFTESVSSQTVSVGLLAQGDTLLLNIDENTTVYLWGDGANADLRALYCKQ